jgi:hypothetical protein
MKQSGIYKIVNTVTGKFYLGSAVNVFARWKCHRRNLRTSHIGQKSWSIGQTKVTNQSLKKLSISKTGKRRDNIAKEYLFLNPTGVLIKVVNLRQFCISNGLIETNMNKVFRGICGYKSHRGWKPYKEEHV